MYCSSRFVFVGRQAADLLQNACGTRVIAMVSMPKRNMSTNQYSFDTLKVSSPCSNVLQVELNRPEKLNAMNTKLFSEVGNCFRQIQDDKECRAVVLSAAGRMFTAGLDLTDLAEMNAVLQSEEDIARKAKYFRSKVITLQEPLTAMEKCQKPVIAAVHGACIGGGVDMICATDVRYCTQDAWFQVKEVGIGMAADIGTLQRLPKVVGNDSWVREIAFTARKFEAMEAKEKGLVSAVFPDKDALVKAAVALAKLIASNSPVAVQGTKMCLNYSRDHSVADGLDYMATWNMCMLQSEDLMHAAMAAMTKADEPPTFSKL